MTEVQEVNTYCYIMYKFGMTKFLMQFKYFTVMKNYVVMIWKIEQTKKTKIYIRQILFCELIK